MMWSWKLESIVDSLDKMSSSLDDSQWNVR